MWRSLHLGGNATMFRLYQSVVFLFAFFLSLHARSESGFDGFVSQAQEAARQAAQAAADKAKLEALQTQNLAATGTNYSGCEGVNASGESYAKFVQCVTAAKSPERNIVNQIETALDQSGVPRQEQVAAVCAAMQAKAKEVEAFMATAESTSSAGIVPTTDSSQQTGTTGTETASADKTTTETSTTKSSSLTTGQGVTSTGGTTGGNGGGTTTKTGGGGFDWLTSSKTVVGRGVRALTGRGVDGLSTAGTTADLASILGLSEGTITGSGGTQSTGTGAGQSFAQALASTSKDQNTITSQRLAAELNALADQCRAAQATRDAAATELAAGVQQLVEGDKTPIDVNLLLQGSGG